MSENFIRRPAPSVLRALAVVVLLTVLTACSGETPTDPAAAEEAQPEEALPIVTEEPQPEPEPKSGQPLTIEEAADRYLEIVGPTNAALLEEEALANDGRYREACEAMARPLGEATDSLAAEDWPGDVDRLVKDQLIPLMKNEADAYNSCADASDDRRAEDIYWLDTYAAYEARSPVSGAVRTLLGLPQVTP